MTCDVSPFFYLFLKFFFLKISKYIIYLCKLILIDKLTFSKFGLFN